jgi:hypothetical protein
MHLKADLPLEPKYLPAFAAGSCSMKRLAALLSSLLHNEWREIASAPFDREIEVAVIDGDINVHGISCLRHGDGWLDSETMRPTKVTATHWRYGRRAMLPIGCC